MLEHYKAHDKKAVLFYFMRAGDPVAVRELRSLVAGGMDVELVPFGCPSAGQYVVKVLPGGAAPRGDNL